MKLFLQSVIWVTLIKFIVFNINVYKQTKPAYETAFEYIKTHNRDTPIITIDTTVKIGLTSFATELGKEWNLKQVRVLNILDSADRINIGHGAKITGLKNLKSSGGKEARVLYFAAMVDTILMAEVMPRRRIYTLKKYRGDADYNSLDYRNQASYNNSVQYLFIFDHYMHLKKVFAHKVFYD